MFSASFTGEGLGIMRHAATAPAIASKAQIHITSRKLATKEPVIATRI
jgi:hypothetical protein